MKALELLHSVCDAEQGAKLLLAQVLIDGLLHVGRHRRGALVQNGKLRLVVEQSANIN